MKIKRLELLGFKSFKDRTVINFDHGITGIVGPNGCGKSNIVDALTWVMGEQSSKHLRGSSMEDVIFSGSQDYAPTGFAEVSLTMENDGGLFPAKWAKFSEVMVTRRLHRNGESEYEINREPSRLKDIHEIFMDTGAGSRGFSIVEQGQIGKIITAKPEDRRTLIEEAAGITKFKVRKKESQRKLEGTEQNLYRLNDIVGELKRQIESLQRQAKRAERYRELKTRIQELDVWLGAVKFDSLNKEVSDLTVSLDERKVRYEQTQAQYSTEMAELQALKLELLEMELSVSRCQGEHFEAQAATQKKESEIQLLQHDIESTKRSEEMTGTLRAEIEARLEILMREHGTTKSQLSEVEAEVITLAEHAKKASETSAHAQNRSREIDNELTTSRRELMTLNQGLTTIEVRKGALNGQVEELDKRLNHCLAVKTELETNRTDFEARRNKTFSQLESQRQMQLSIMNDVENFRANLEILERDFSDKEAQVAAFKDEFNQVVSRLEGLETINNNFDGLKEGVKNVMTWHRQRLQPSASGGYELVADVVEAPKDLELALEAAMGERLQSIITSESSVAMSAVEMLKEKNAGRSSFLSQDLVSEVGARGSDSDLQAEPGVRGFLKDLVRVKDDFVRPMAHILDGVIVVDSLRTALGLRSRYSGYSFVTSEGDVLTHDGTITGGSGQSADSGLLRQKREIKELALRKEENTGKLALALAALDKVEAQRDQVKKDLELGEKQNFEQEMKILDLKKELERAEGELKNAEEALRRQTKEESGLTEQLAGLRTQMDEAQNAINDLLVRRNTLNETCQRLEVELESFRTDLERLSLEATEAQVRLAAKEQQVHGVRTQLQRLEENLRDAQLQISRHSEESSKNLEFLNAHIMKIEEYKAEFSRMVDDVENKSRELKATRDRFEQKGAVIRELDSKVSELQRTSNDLSQGIGQDQVKLSQMEMNLRYLVDQMRERYMLEISSVAAEYVARPADIPALQSELDELRDKANKIGEVNLTAIQEYEEVSKRYEFLTQQQQDLISSMESLRKVIDRINRICNRRFRDTFEMVNERFKKVFPVLFGGGEAQLNIVEDPLGEKDPGVEIMAKPPGKKLQSVTLLSGGEKALTAISLIFAIFLVKPSPFCLLDEVDAPLDDANVYRFNDLVKEMSKRSQVIVVTHNKHTMSINNKLYGVTMEEPGVSKMVAVQLQ